jgi:phospholipase C
VQVCGRWLSGAVLLAVLGAAGPAVAQISASPLVTPQPDPPAGVAPFVIPSADAAPSRDTLIEALRRRVKYVFVIFNENHSFDNEFGTFPGANGLYSDGTKPRDPAHTPGFFQTYTDQAGHVQTVTPFRIGPAQNASFVDSVDHSHPGLAVKLHVVDGAPHMDGFAHDEYARFAAKKEPAMGAQFARLVMSHIDCDTIPFFWQYASRFALFDNIFATEDTPSTPNAIAMIAGQSGETQWVEHGAGGQAMTGAGGAAATTQGPPLVNDPQPFWGSQFDPARNDREPKGGLEENYANGNVASNLTFASLPLTFGGGALQDMVAQDFAPELDLADVAKDVPFIVSRHGVPVNWRWYQEGYDHEPTDPHGAATHAFYVSHHEGPQYFGYIANNPAFSRNLRGEGDFFEDLRSGNMPVGGGVFYIRGGFGNLLGIPESRRPDTVRDRGDQCRKIGRRRPSGVQRPADQRSNGGTGHQCYRGQAGNLEPECHHHHLRRVGRLL